ncbi:transaldolase [Solimonas sp. K1W22B-7]|uniref:transaldolase n=1 Tax=Solimonas sp. K1W22B-7 TaxID=2303331 RepID=UPI000E331A33|nr:transaldolase [Solimonas sp. K1W22B-7]AXQ31667.1 transaldolase [Solimonas sp. K1W22B-7]
MSALKAISEHGQSVWLDYIRRDLLLSGGLKKLIDEDGLLGLTSNPAIFEKAIGGSADYDPALRALVDGGQRDPAALYEQLAIEDIRQAADIFLPVWQATGGVDGYVSLEVAPGLACDTAGTLADARRLWAAVRRPNLMIKVPGTAEGAVAVRELIAEGINVNVTLLFSRPAYLAVAEAYLAGLEARLAAGGRIDGIASVASFFISRIDAAMDAEIAARGGEALALAGKVAIANARLAYEDYRGLCAGPRWQKLAAAGARPQRLLWASTGTKNPAYRDVLYVEELIGPETVDTIPPATMDAFRDHGQPRRSLDRGTADAREVIAAVERLGLPLDAVTTRLVGEGIKLFVDAHDQLLAAVARKRDALAPQAMPA